MVDPHHTPTLGRTPCPPSRRSFRDLLLPADPLVYSQAGNNSTPNWVGPVQAHGSRTGPQRAALHRRFDSTLGFLGEGPCDPPCTPWFLTTSKTRVSGDRKRHFSRIGAAERRLFSDGASSVPSSHGGSVDTALGWFLKAHRHGRDPYVAAGVSTLPPPADTKNLDTTPVPRSASPAPLAFSCPREALEFTHPLPPVPAGTSLRRTFICHFGGLNGMDAASFEEVWKVAKNGYNNAYDAPFLRFHADLWRTTRRAGFTRWAFNQATWWVSCGANASADRHTPP
jgi:hypothetical protein